MQQHILPSAAQSTIQTTTTTVAANQSNTTTITGNVLISTAANTTSLIKPSLPTVKLQNAGPPPLTNVPNNSTTSSAMNLQQSTHQSADIKDENAQNVAMSSTQSECVDKVAQNTVAATTASTHTAASSSATAAVNTGVNSTQSQQPIQQQQQQQPPQPAAAQLTALDAQWLYICDWRNCPRKKYKSLNDLQHHVCSSHAPDHLDQSAEIFCQWGIGPGLCDGIPRKRFSLMTHLIDRHMTTDSLRQAVQRRIATGMHNIAPLKPPVTIVRNIEQASSQRANNASPAPSTSSSSSSQQTAVTGASALQAIKRHTADFLNSKELMDENEGPVTKSIRLTAALILRNLVTYTATAKRSVRRYEPHLSNIALSNVESSATISNILYELNN